MEIPDWAKEWVRVLDNGCWEWTGERNKKTGRPKSKNWCGHGIVGAQPKMYSTFISPLGGHERVKTTCGEKYCMNPAHFVVKHEEQ